MAQRLSRREWLQAGMMMALGSTVGGAQTTLQREGVRALVFDTFGTVVDWRSSVAAEVRDLARRKGVTVNAEQFADAWRAGYGPSMNRVRSGELPWTKLDVLHRMTLDRILVEFKITELTEEETASLNRAWHRLKPWPDAVAGLTRLKKKFTIAPLSNGNISLMTDLAKFAGLPWQEKVRPMCSGAVTGVAAHIQKARSAFDHKRGANFVHKTRLADRKPALDYRREEQ